MPVNNILYDVMPKILSQALDTLREAAIMPSLVNSSYTNEAAQKGQVIQIPVPSAITATDVVPAAYAPDTGDIQPDTIPLKLDQWKEAAFTLNDKELMEVMDGVSNMQIAEAARAIANAVDLSLLNLYKKIPNFTGTAGTTPFASTIADGINARKILTRNLAPMQNRYIVLDPEAEANVLMLDAFRKANESGSDVTIREAQIGRKLGFDWFLDELCPFHTSGSILPKNGTIQVKTIPTVTSVADSSDPILHNPRTVNQVVLKTVTSGGVVVGDIFSVAGDKQQYTVTQVANSATNEITVQFSPAPAVIWPADSVVSFRASHQLSYAFHRDAFALAVRPQAMNSAVAQELGGGASMVMSDPVSGIPMRLEIKREHKRIRFALDCLWGVAAVRPAHAVRILG